MKKTLIISIAAILVAVLALGAVGYVLWDKHNVPAEEPVPEVEEVVDPIEEASAQSASIYAVRGVRMMASAPMAVSEDVMTQTITATVLPVTATNKAVDWSVSWANLDGEFEKAHNVTDYVTVTPSADGSTTATITAHQAFEGTPVAVTVTTRAGGFKAESIVTYIGIPTVMQIADNGEFDSNGRYAANAQTTTNFNIDLSNIFDVVTDAYLNEYASFEVVSVQANGSFECSGKTFNSMINMWLPSGENKVINLADIADGLFSAEIVGGKLQITAGKPIESYAFNETIDGSAVGLPSTTTMYNYASGVENCYFTVTIKDNYTGLTATANFYISCEASGVTLDAESLLF